MRTDPKLTAWMGRNRRATLLELRQGGRMVGSWSKEEHPEDGTLQESILDAAEGDAAELVGRVVYEVSALLPSGRVIGTTRFTMHGGAGEEEPSDDPTLPAMLRNNQRHLEATQKMMHGMFAAMVDRANETIRSQGERIRDLESRELELMHLREELLSMRHERELASAEAKSRADIQRQVLGEIAPALPSVFGAIASKFLPAGALPPSETPDAAALEALVKSMTDEQLEAVVAQLTPGQKVALSTVWHHAVERMKARAARSGSGGGGEGEGNGGGGASGPN